ncbi:MAG: protease complex subunit PrcB family protein [Candidatus Thorarchaeota archaeon]|nr:protease complex subunit PrcB family protein [Candidatus Thorarchaeota archaeon]NIW15105.1 protease complex subunit PrcB family protein [Candidatus Thorarchaeota archaeon]NIW53119.1 protease complex subunit PrcB family protein [Candidatus Korarchaeota archaeon]
MLNDITQEASTTDLISILISRGGFTTGGYQIQIKSHAWLEDEPPVCFFEVNFTDPGKGISVTEALTNPVVLVPIGKLSLGKYIARAHIDSFILTYDPAGKPVFTPVKTLVEEVWEVEFEIK